MSKIVKKKKRKRKFSWKSFFFFIVYMVFFTGVSSFLITLYGPFENVKRTFVGTAMSTMTHKYFATWFLSKSEIDSLIGSNVKADTTSQDDTQEEKKVVISHKADNTIERYDIPTARFNAYVLEISDPRRIKIGVTSKLNTRGETTSKIAENNGGIAAINGGGFKDSSTDSTKTYVGTGASPSGYVITGGVIKSNSFSNDAQIDSIAFDKEGKFIVGKHSANELLSMGVTEAICFNKTLISGGKGQVKGDGGQGIQPRTAIGQTATGKVIMVVIDGRSGLKQGASLKELQDLLLSRGAVNAANLDGGSSTTMYYDGNIINEPCDSSGERNVATAIYVTP